jgi:murein DD-endopeptidase MepM/ murein hydrolase activator NlpD
MLLVSAFLAVSAAAFAFHHEQAPHESSPPLAVAAEARSNEAAREPDTRDDGRFDDIIKSAVNDALAVPAPSDWSLVTVKAGQTLSTIFEDLSLPPEDWMAVVRLGGDCSQLKRLRNGEQLHLRLAAGRLQELSYTLDETRTLSVRRSSRGFESTTLTTALEHRRAESVGMIENSLFADARKAGLADRMILEFADLFGYDIDFAQDLQEGDRFAVVYDQLYKNGKKLRDGDILAAEFVSQGRKYRAVRFVAADGSKAYYTPEGLSLRKAFIRTPVDFARISSGFNLHRLHPILNIIRAHKGVDYAAAIGTPVHATGDGKVEFIGRKNGYGNVLMIRHGSQYETVYGHLSRFAAGLRDGSTIHQGQVVAYVGMSGLATAPHLHYEFRVNGIHQNPVTVQLPRALPLPALTLARFRNEAAPLVATLDRVESSKFARLER